jgi:hypothetical protein
MILEVKGGPKLRAQGCRAQMCLYRHLNAVRGSPYGTLGGWCAAVGMVKRVSDPAQRDRGSAVGCEIGVRKVEMGNY